ncbi:uncharacterized protein si:ch211-151h10.2 [Colossoma macropomum]|uniref:uncharacterized protein si:ch211-151h10.2 n=1 Tax=Colossoma macropomum TaxID=42526 RepID=UPI0018651F57|nr:uncharacterized protein si:ch211-151h10.2 [Colossoma macropomum]
MRGTVRGMERRRGEKKGEGKSRRGQKECRVGAGRVCAGNTGPSGLQCLAQVAALWLVVQEEAPLHPSVSLLESGYRLLLAGLLWAGLGLCVSLLQFLYHYRKTHKQESREVSQNSENSEVAVRGPEQVQQACQQDAGHLVAMVSALLDGMVVSLLHEPLSNSSLSQIRGLLTRLEAVSQAVCKGSLHKGQQLQASDEEGKVSEEESSLKDKFKHICTYLQDRVSVLCSLLQVQDHYGVCVADVQEGLQVHWELLENLHTRVTLKPEKCQSLEDPHTVLLDTESLYTQLGLFRSRVHECQTHLNTSTQLLQELESSQQVLADTVGVTLEATWTKDFLQCNTQQFEKVHEDFMSLEQQTLTFVTHLRGLRVSEEGSKVSLSDLEHSQSAPSSPVSAVPVYSVALATENPILDPDPEPPPKSSSKLSAMNCLCGVRRRK